ncbi:creB [Malassezia furfur]|nr:creB [Malassezia furfur]
MSSFSWKGIFGISVPDSSGSPSGRSGSQRKTSGGPRVASSAGSAASPPSGSVGAAGAARPNAIRTDVNGTSAGTGSPMRSSAGVSSSPSTFGSQRPDEAALAASFPLSLGWTAPEWREWSRDSGHHVHDSDTKTALLGIENFGNTCYANSVLQALYFCAPLREAVMEADAAHVSPVVRRSDTLHTALVRLFHTMAREASRISIESGDAPAKREASGTPAIVSRTVNTEAIKTFLETLMRNCDLFDMSMHHDAHEFLNFTLNQVGEDLEALHAPARGAGSVGSGSAPATRGDDDTQRTYVHDLFQGVLTNETKCLTCENVSYRDEAFLDLSVNVSPNTSLSSCLRQFSESEMLHGRNKFFCDACASLQEAEKRMKIRHAPNILALHLKRFIWDERVQAYVKHACRVVFPLDLRLFNMSDQADNPDRRYELFAIVIHVGAGANQGHYISIVKIGQRWALFDDETVTFIAESDIAKYYGDAPEIGSAYVLFYRAVELDERAAHAAAQITHHTPAASAAAPAAPLGHGAPPAPSSSARAMPMPIAVPVAGRGAPASASTHAPPTWSPTSMSSQATLASSAGMAPAVPIPPAMSPTLSTGPAPVLSASPGGGVPEVMSVPLPRARAQQPVESATPAASATPVASPPYRGAGTSYMSTTPSMMDLRPPAADVPLRGTPLPVPPRSPYRNSMYAASPTHGDGGASMTRSMSQRASFLGEAAPAIRSTDGAPPSRMTPSISLAHIPTSPPSAGVSAGAPAGVPMPRPEVIAVPRNRTQAVPAPAVFPNTPSPTMPTKMGEAVPMLRAASTAARAAPAPAAPADAHRSMSASMPRSHTMHNLSSRSAATPEVRAAEAPAPTKRSWLNRALRIDRTDKN